MRRVDLTEDDLVLLVNGLRSLLAEKRHALVARWYDPAVSEPDREDARVEYGEVFALFRRLHALL